VPARVRTVGLPAVFPLHGKRAQVLAEAGLTGQDVARDVAGWVSALEPEPAAESPAPTEQDPVRSETMEP